MVSPASGLRDLLISWRKGGSHGTVWASHLGGHELAIKVLKEPKHLDALFEASIAERLEHPNVVRLLDCVADVRKSLLV